MVSKNLVDIKENDIIKYDKELLPILLKDHSSKKNIIWATDNYVFLGNGYGETDEITVSQITGKNGDIIKPRVNKSKTEQLSRVRDKAEVFTPSWICNVQNNLIDEAWFGRKNVFNKETPFEGKHSWKATSDKIVFPEGKTWHEYVRENRLEISCGEAPYLVSRYDATTGDAIPIEQRIGLLDRKLRIVGENTETTSDWLEWAQTAYKSTYGYEWQGDNLLLAREALLYTFKDYYNHKFGKDPLHVSMKYIAYIISWNLWQMDGLKGVIPNSCKEKEELSLFGDVTKTPCKGCQDEGFLSHTGIYCLVKDWSSKDPDTKKLGRKYRFIDLLK
jgi:hypothetical protein